MRGAVGGRQPAEAKPPLSRSFYICARSTTHVETRNLHHLDGQHVLSTPPAVDVGKDKCTLC